MAENNEIIDEIFLEFEEELEKATAHLKSEYLSLIIIIVFDIIIVAILEITSIIKI